MNRQRRMRTLAVLLVFGMLLSWMPAGTISLPAQATTDATGATAELSPSTFQLDADCQLLQYVDEAVISAGNHVARLKEKETLSTYVFLNEDGTQTVYYMDENVKFVDSTGAVREKDISLTATRSGFTTASNDVALSLPSDLGKGIGLSYGGYDVTMIPENITTATVQQQDGKIAYLNCYGKGTGLIYTPTLSGLKEDILLSAYTGVNSFSFLLNTDGLRPYTDAQGRYYFATSANAAFKLELADIVAYDANARFSLGSITITPITMGQQYRLTVTVDEEFLTAETTTYPVMIDPTITVSDNTHGAGAIEDATVYSNQLTLNTGTWPYNHAGYYDSTYGTGRVVYRLSGLLEDAAYQSMGVSEIDSAILYLTEATGSASAQVNLYAFTSNSSWSETNITWNTMGTSSSTVYAQGYLSYNQTTAFNITNMVKEWKNGTLNGEHGFSMRLANESAASKGVIASEYSVASKRPYVVVTYSAPEFASGYYLISQGENTKFLTPEEISYANGTGLSIMARSTEKPVALSQIWKVVYQGSGRYTISAIYKENLYLTANSNSAVQLSADLTGLSRLWTFEENGGVYTIKNCTFTDRALTGTANNEGVATLATFNENSTIQSWIITQTTPKGMMLLDSETGKRRDAEADFGSVYLPINTAKTITDLGLTLKIFDDTLISQAYIITFDTETLSFNLTNNLIGGTSYCCAVATIKTAIDNTLFQISFNLYVLKPIAVYNYYDSSFSAAYLNYIDEAISFSNKAYLYHSYTNDFKCEYQYFYLKEGTPVNYSSLDTKYGQCQQTNNCVTGATYCGTDCYSHHKNAKRIAETLESLPISNEKYVQVLWTSYPSYYFCDKNILGNHQTVNSLACVYNDSNHMDMFIPKQVIHFMRNPETSSNNTLAFMSITLAHELAHTHGIKDVYDEPNHDILNGYHCVMERYDSRYAESFYKRVKEGITPAFCESCITYLAFTLDTQ